MVVKSVRNQIHDIILEMKSAGDFPETHTTMGGKRVPFGCAGCVRDLEKRIEDAKHSRDARSHRTDAREHYNGILKILRRDLRGARKVLEGS